MDLKIGSNLYRNTDGMVEVGGVPQLEVKLRKPGGPVLVNFVVFDRDGRIRAKMVNSAMTINEQRTYDLDVCPTGLTLKRTDSGKEVLTVNLEDGNCVAISAGEFYTIKGNLIEITPTEWRIEDRRMSGADVNLEGKAVSIG